jgi:hypothetical protein
MSNKGLKVAPPPRPSSDKKPPQQKRAKTPTKFKHIAETDTVQFNHRVQQGTKDGFGMLAIKLRRTVPDLLAEGLELLEEKYGKV